MFFYKYVTINIIVKYFWNIQSSSYNTLIFIFYDSGCLRKENESSFRGKVLILKCSFHNVSYIFMDNNLRVEKQ